MRRYRIPDRQETHKYCIVTCSILISSRRKRHPSSPRIPYYTSSVQSDSLEPFVMNRLRMIPSSPLRRFGLLFVAILAVSLAAAGCNKTAAEGTPNAPGGGAPGGGGGRGGRGGRGGGAQPVT